MNRVDLKAIKPENKKFWNAFFALSYPNGYDEETDLSVEDIAGELTDWDWWDEFCGYYEGVLEECDGYLEEPAYIEVEMDQDKLLRIEFHPGDILYYVNGEVVGSTGPHWKLQVFSFEMLEQMLGMENGEILFWLLLPLAGITQKSIDEATEKLRVKLADFFDTDICEDMAGCLINQLIAGE